MAMFNEEVLDDLCDDNSLPSLDNVPSYSHVEIRSSESLEDLLLEDSYKSFSEHEVLENGSNKRIDASKNPNFDAKNSCFYVFGSPFKLAYILDKITRSTYHYIVSDKKKRTVILLAKSVHHYVLFLCVLDIAIKNNISSNKTDCLKRAADETKVKTPAPGSTSKRPHDIIYEKYEPKDRVANRLAKPKKVTSKKAKNVEKSSPSASLLPKSASSVSFDEVLSSHCDDELAEFSVDEEDYAANFASAPDKHKALDACMALCATLLPHQIQMVVDACSACTKLNQKDWNEVFGKVKPTVDVLSFPVLLEWCSKSNPIIVEDGTSAITCHPVNFETPVRSTHMSASNVVNRVMINPDFENLVSYVILTERLIFTECKVLHLQARHPNWIRLSNVTYFLNNGERQGWAINSGFFLTLEVALKRVFLCDSIYVVSGGSLTMAGIPLIAQCVWHFVLTVYLVDCVTSQCNKNFDTIEECVSFVEAKTNVLLHNLGRKFIFEQWREKLIVCGDVLCVKCIVCFDEILGRVYL